MICEEIDYWGCRLDVVRVRARWLPSPSVAAEHYQRHLSGHYPGREVGTGEQLAAKERLTPRQAAKLKRMRYG